MMDPARVASMPPRPAGLPEWEDLLVRFEIMGRAVRVGLEDARARPAVVADVLSSMVSDEAAVGAWLQRASGIGDDPAPDAGADPAPGAGSSDAAPPAAPDLRGLADRFVSLRARNFAMLQRRGIDVWEWSAVLPGAGGVTAHQVVAARLIDDADALRALRDGSRTATGTC